MKLRRRRRDRARRPPRTSAPCVVVAVVSSTTGAAKECVKYADALGGRPSSRRESLRRRCQRVPADVRHLDVAAELEAAAGEYAEARRGQALRRCRRRATAGPRQMPSNGRPRRSRRRMALRQSASIARRRGEVSDARDDDGARAIEARRRVDQAHVRPNRDAGLGDRRQIAGAIVDERDRSQQSLRRRQHPREPAVARARDAQRAGERLEDRLDLVMTRPAVQHLQVHVGARGRREALEEVLHELGRQIADLFRRQAEIDDGEAAGRRDRSPRRRASRPSASRSSRRG